jgi:hypothetical protein
MSELSLPTGYDSMVAMLKRVPRRIAGITHAPVTVRNIVTGNAFTTDCLLDPEVKNSVLPASELRKIGIKPVGKRIYEVAEGKFEEHEHAYAEISFLEETTISQILFGPEDAQPVLGALSLTAAGIILDPDVISQDQA